jgi:hypothetical protein
MDARSSRNVAIAAAIASAAVLITSCGSHARESISVPQGGTRLAALLRKHGVRPGHDVERRASFAAAWAAFKEFAAVPVDRRELTGDSLDDGFLFEAGVFDFGGRWGETFEVSFVRQLATRDGDLQQVHLVVHFPSGSWKRLGARGLAPNRYSANPWSWDAGGSSKDQQRASWIASVERSTVFRNAVTGRVKPLGYEVWQDSAE